jgi:hypothetical protein
MWRGHFNNYDSTITNQAEYMVIQGDHVINF